MPPPPALSNPWIARFSVLFGSFLGLSLLKFGNPAIFNDLVGRPQGIAEILFNPWPITWAYGLLAIVALTGALARLTQSSHPSRTVLHTLRNDPAQRILCAFLLGWLSWQLVATVASSNSKLSLPTVIYFFSCAICFAFGRWILGCARSIRPFWIPLAAGFGFVLWLGLEQHFGGLDATRKHFYSQPDWQQYPPDFIKRIESNRIFSTLFYPNTLAGAIILLFPAASIGLWAWSARWPRLVRLSITGFWLFAGLGCLFWTGSKAGWLISLAVSAAWLFLQPISRSLKLAIAILLITGGLAGFFVKFAPYFKKGATSVSARFHYWTAAVKTTQANPITGTGPGTFGAAYARIKPPEAEMAKMVHNDYLEQASDSGLPGAFFYSAFIAGVLVHLFRRRNRAASFLFIPTWLGLFGWSLHAAVEFPLYIPALAWSAFTLFGLLLAQVAPETLGRHSSTTPLPSPSEP